MNKEQAKQRIKELKVDIKAHKAEIKELKEVINKPEWKPPKGTFWNDVNGEIYDCYSNREARLFGSEYKTKEQAEKRALQLKFQNWLFHLAEDLNDGWVSDLKSEKKHYIYYEKGEWKYYFSYRSIEPEKTCFKDRETALKAIEIVKTWKWAEELLR